MGKNYWTIWVATLLFFVAFYTLLIPFPLYLADVNLPDWQIAVVLGAMGIASRLCYSACPMETSDRSDEQLMERLRSDGGEDALSELLAGRVPDLTDLTRFGK